MIINPEASSPVPPAAVGAGEEDDACVTVNVDAGCATALYVDVTLEFVDVTLELADVTEDIITEIVGVTGVVFDFGTFGVLVVGDPAA